ncbi:MAG: SRPBCC family protein [Elusimicrobia bacterium]|nr:SRPBCC family protein [Elusimicrobiota bacterium]
MKESFSFDVKKSPSEVFESLTDLQRIAELSGGKLVIKPVPDRPLRGIGSAVYLCADVPGAPAGAAQDILCETLEWSPPHLCTRKFGIKDLPTTAVIRVEERDGGSRLTVEVEVVPESMMYKMMLPMLAVKLKGDKEKLVAQLQQQLDRQA